MHVHKIHQVLLCVANYYNVSCLINTAVVHSNTLNLWLPYDIQDAGILSAFTAVIAATEEVYRSTMVLQYNRLKVLLQRYCKQKKVDCIQLLKEQSHLNSKVKFVGMGGINLILPKKCISVSLIFVQLAGIHLFQASVHPFIKRYSFKPGTHKSYKPTSEFLSKLTVKSAPTTYCPSTHNRSHRQCA